MIYAWFVKHNLAIFALLIFVANTFWVLKFEKRLKIKLHEGIIISLVHVILGWTCMKLLALIEVGFDFEKAANMRLFGAVFVLPILYYLWAKKTDKDIHLTSDMSAICVIFGAISGRLNCMTQGCCQGILFPFDFCERWPLRETELVFYFLFIIIFAGRILKGKTNGEVYPVYMISYGIIRFVCEFFREEFTTQVGVLHLAHIWAVLSVIIGLIWLWYIKTEQSKNRRHATK